MPHPEVHNHSRLAAEVALLADEAGTPLLVPIVQATFAIGNDGTLTLLDEQPTIEMAGETWGPMPNASWRLEPQQAFVKPGCDVVLLGHAVAPRPGVRQMTVTFHAGSLARTALVFGDRWRRRGRTSEPLPFERIELRYERAFGGWDRRQADMRKHRSDPRNDVGLGFRDPDLPRDDEVRLPNLEDPQHPSDRDGPGPPPVGFGFVSPHWQPRASFAGTYDAAWFDTRMPLLPADFDRRFFNAASPGMVATRPFTGDDVFRIEGTRPGAPLQFNFPEVGRPVFNALLRGRRRQAVKLTLDTVIVDTDTMRLLLTWRAHLEVPRGLHDLAEAEFHLPDARARRWRAAA